MKFTRPYSALRAPVILEKIREKFQFGGESAKVYLEVVRNYKKWFSPGLITVKIDLGLISMKIKIKV
jgi:hypothetical protein